MQVVKEGIELVGKWFELCVKGAGKQKRQRTERVGRERDGEGGGKTRGARGARGRGQGEREMLRPEGR